MDMDYEITLSVEVRCSVKVPEEYLKFDKVIAAANSFDIDENEDIFNILNENSDPWLEYTITLNSSYSDDFEPENEEDLDERYDEINEHYEDILTDMYTLSGKDFKLSVATLTITGNPAP